VVNQSVWARAALLRVIGHRSWKVADLGVSAESFEKAMSALDRALSMMYSVLSIRTDQARRQLAHQMLVRRQPKCQASVRSSEGNPRSIMKRRCGLQVAMVAAAVCAALTLAACSSSSSTSAGTATQADSSAVKVMVIGPISGSTSYNFPSIQKVQSAYFDKINSSGGINGHRVDITFCTDKNDPGTAAACGNEAVADGDVVVMSSSALSASFAPILQAHQIPWLSESIQSLAEGTSPYAFPVTAAAAQWGYVMGKSFAGEGCKTAAAIYVDAPTVQAVFAEVQAALTASGASIPSNLKFEVSATDASFLPQVLQIVNSGAQCVFGLLTPTQANAVETAIIGSNKPALPLMTYCAAVSPDVAKLFAGAGNGNVACGARLPGETGLPVLNTIQSIAGSDYDAASILNWAMADVLTAALKAVPGPVTTESVYNSLSHLTNVSTQGIIPPYTTSATPKVINGYTRVFNPTVNWWKYNSQGKPVMQQSINAAS
jgi:ABC-type branched-subunit amino acid transport system substrate-binding protein